MHATQYEDHVTEIVIADQTYHREDKTHNKLALVLDDHSLS